MIQELIDSYEQRLGAYMQQIEVYCSKKRRAALPVSPSYVEEVLMPIFKALASALPRGYGKLRVPNPQTYYPIKDHYRIKVGAKVAGGFPVPHYDDLTLYFVPMVSLTSHGKRVKVESIEQLSSLVIEVIKEK